MAGERRTLFPCTATPEAPPALTLFPCIVDSKPHTKTDKLSWLENSSFPDALIEKVNQPEKSAYQKSKDDESRYNAVHGNEKSSKSSAHKCPSKRSKDVEKPKKDKKKKSKDKKKHKDKKGERRKQEKGEEGLFEIARERDRNNIKYGGLYKFDIPEYRVYQKQYLGEENKAFFKRCPARSDDCRYYNSLHPAQRHLEHSTPYDNYPVTSLFIGLESSSIHWASIKSVKSNKQVTEFPEHKATFSSSDPAKIDPHNLDLWVEFITSTDTSKVGLERRHAIIDRALKHLPANDTLLDLKIETCSSYMSATDIGKMWTDILFHQPNILSLWEKFIYYKEQTLAEFNIGSVLAVYKKCIKTLLGLKSGAFRSHKFEGNVNEALVSIAMKLGNFLMNIGHSEKAIALFTVLIELNCKSESEKSVKDLVEGEFSQYWSSGAVRLGDDNFVNWVRGGDMSYREEIDTEVSQGEEVWDVWVREEGRKSEQGWLPVNCEYDQGVLDPNCSVSLIWIKPFMFQCDPLDILVSYFRVFLPVEFKNVPLWALQFCDLCLEKSKAEYLYNVMKQVIQRFNTAQQSTIGYLWFLAAKSLKHKPGKFIKSLLKHPAHRNNFTYWTIFLNNTSQQAPILQTLVTSVEDGPDRLYLNLLLAKSLIADGDREGGLAVLLEGDSAMNCINNLNRGLEEVKVSEWPSADPKGSLHCNQIVSIYCKLHVVRAMADKPDRQGLVDVIQRLGDDKDALFHLFNLLLAFEQSLTEISSTSLKTLCLLSVEVFPELPSFWSLLSQHVPLTAKLWQRLNSQYSWYNRIQSEHMKQVNNTDLNLSHRILALCSQAVERYPHSIRLWQLYLHCSAQYNQSITSSVIVRAIKNNPSYKALYLTGIRLCEEERGSLYQLMEEKQVRIRVLMEEVEMLTEMEGKYGEYVPYVEEREDSEENVEEVVGKSLAVFD